MIPDKALIPVITKGGRDNTELAIGVLLVYKIIPSVGRTEEAIREAKAIVATKSHWISPQSLPEYSVEVEDTLIKGGENEAIISIRNKIKEFYGLTSKPQPEEDEEDNPEILEDLDDFLGMLRDEEAAEDEDIQKALENLLENKPDEDGVIVDVDKSKKPETGSDTFAVEDPNNPEHPKLYPEINYIKPRYMKGMHGLYDLAFESDIDKAIYFAGKHDEPGKRSKLKADVRQWLQDVTGLNYYEDSIQIKKYRAKILSKIKSIIENQRKNYDPDVPIIVDEDAVDVFVPTIYDGFFQDPYEEDEEGDEEKLDNQKSQEQRMEEAFEKNLDDLLDDIKKPKLPKQPKKRGRKPKKTLPKKPKSKSVSPAKKKTSGFSLPSRGNEKSLAEYFNNKIADSFSLALQANKRNKAMDGPKKPPGFFLKKALLHRFGGDLFNRSVGTFSSNPENYQDPALSKEQRFSASLDGTTPPKPLPKPESKGPKQLEFDFTNRSGSVSYTEKSSPVHDVDTRTIVEKYSTTLNKSYKQLSKNFKSLLNKNNAKIVSKSQQESLLNTLPKIFESIKASIQKNNDKEKELIKVKGETLEVIKDAREFEKDALKEAGLENDKDLSSSFDYQFDFTEPLEDEEDEEGSDRGPLDWFGDMFDIFDIFDFQRDKKKPRARSRRRIKGGKPKSIIPKVKPQSKPLGKIGREITTTALGKGAGKAAGKMGTKTVLKAIPGIGIIAGAAYGMERFMKGDILGGIGEITSGIVSVVPKVGTALSIAIDAGLAARDINSTPPKLAAGGIVDGSQRVMVGEAGPEAILPLGNSEAQNIMALMPMTMGLTVPSILGVTKQIIKNSRTGSSVEPYIEQKIAPLSRIFGIETIAMNSNIGEGMSAVKGASKSQENNGILDKIKSLFGNIFGGKSNRKSKAGGVATSGSDSPSVTGTGTGQWGPLLELIASKESGGNYEAMYPSTTLPGATKMTISEVARTATGAVGKYQQRPEYLVGRAKAAGLNPDRDLYSPANQDMIAGKVNIGINRGGDKWLAGKISTEQFMQNLSMEFAALPNSYGNFHYRGQRSAITPDQVRGALQKVKTTPATPTQMDAPVAMAPPQAPNSPFTLQPAETTPAPATANMQQLPESIKNLASSGASVSPVSINVFGTPMVTGYNVTKSTPSGGIVTIPFDNKANIIDPTLIQRYRLGSN